MRSSLLARRGLVSTPARIDGLASLSCMGIALPARNGGSRSGPFILMEARLVLQLGEALEQIINESANAWRSFSLAS
jgi:hypothetical protein